VRTSAVTSHFRNPPEAPRFGVCVYCGDRSGYRLACGAHLPLLALDPTYADASGRLDETDYLPETDEADR
jgi:hypothetical protein